MGYVTMTMMAFGLFLSTFAGVVYYYGCESVAGQLSWLPHANLLLTNPGTTLGFGALVMVLSSLCRPTRFE